MNKLFLAFVIGLLFVGCNKTTKDLTNGVSFSLFGSKEKQKKDFVEKNKSTDELVSEWAEKLSQNVISDGGFVPHEGLTDVDAWGNYIKVFYYQENFYSVLKVVSAGNDEKFNTDDDLFRIKYRPNPLMVFSGLNPLGWTILVWIASTLAVLSLFHSKIKKNYRKFLKYFII